MLPKGVCNSGMCISENLKKTIFYVNFMQFKAEKKRYRCEKVQRILVPKALHWMLDSYFQKYKVCILCSRSTKYVNQLLVFQISFDSLA